MCRACWKESPSCRGKPRCRARCPPPPSPSASPGFPWAPPFPPPSACPWSVRSWERGEQGWSFLARPLPARRHQPLPHPSLAHPNCCLPQSCPWKNLSVPLRRGTRTGLHPSGEMGGEDKPPAPLPCPKDKEPAVPPARCAVGSTPGGKFSIALFEGAVLFFFVPVRRVPLNRAVCFQTGVNFSPPPAPTEGTIHGPAPRSGAGSETGRGGIC